MRILTAGISVLEREKFKDRSYDFDKAYYLNKPRGFIWGSTLQKRNGNAFSDWIRFVEDSQYWPKKFTQGISYTLHKNAKICTVASVEDYLDLMDNYSLEVIDNGDYTNTLTKKLILTSENYLQIMMYFI